jgi:hypothetical protein
VLKREASSDLATAGKPSDKPALDTKETVSATLAGNAAKSLGLQVNSLHVLL